MGFDKPSKIQEKALPLMLSDPSVSIKLRLFQLLVVDPTSTTGLPT